MYLLAKVKAFLMEIWIQFLLSETEQLKTGEFVLKLTSKEIRILLNRFSFSVSYFYREKSLVTEENLHFLLWSEIIF